MKTSAELETAGHHHLDNRAIHSIGHTVTDLGRLDPSVRLVTGRSPFFDRPA